MNAHEALDEMIDNPTIGNAIRAHRLVCRERDEGTISEKWAELYLDELNEWMGQETKYFRNKYET